MPLSSGDKLGPYEIIAPIGAGGMGDVYRARDTRLDRIVALKVSKSEFSERFEREARAVAALNHPNICTLHDVGPNYLVMEYIDGTPLRGPLPIDQALKYAVQICDALDAAHKKGITHRDLKPTNILVTKAGIKLLDFGLAKLGTPGIGQGAKSPSDATLTMALTGKNEIVGTLYYMSPEQLQSQATGQEIDGRSDIFSFGLVLYEMLTGKRAFDGASPASVIAAIMERPAPSIADVAPAALDRVLRKCLAKDPDDRWQSARDLKDELEWIAANPAPDMVPANPSARPLWLISIAAGVLLAVAAVTSWGWWRSGISVPQPPKPLVRLSVDLGPDTYRLGSMSFVISPDGNRLIHIVRPAVNTFQLALRALDQAESTVLPFNADGSFPFFSPDSQWIGFAAGSTIQKISVQGGGATPLFELPDFHGASWGETGFIVAASKGGGLVRVPESGGTPKQISSLEPGELTHRWPQILPGGKAVIFTASSSTVAFESATIKAISLDSGRQKTLVRDGYYGRYVPSNGSEPGATGHLVYLHDRVLYAVAFDPAHLELLGSPVPVVTDVAGLNIQGAGHFSFSDNGTFVYLSGALLRDNWTIELMDATGNGQKLISLPGTYATPRFSPDGQRLAVSVAGARGQDIYVYDRQRETMSRLTTSVEQNSSPVWTPDGKHLVYSNGSALFWMRADGAGDPQRLLAPGHTVFPFSFTPDGRRLAYWERNDLGSADIWTLPLDLSDPDHPKPMMPEPFVQGHGPNIEPAFSPDGHWMAYSSQESGTMEVYVRPFPGPGGKWQISNGGGQVPMWSRSGPELFYRGPDYRIMSSVYTTQGNSFSASKPRVWADTETFDPGLEFNVDIAPDGRHFAFFRYSDKAEEAKGGIRATFLLNFFDELRRKAPASGK
jgi:serine/threonine protein kinase/Tol biopolymer transport system component